MTNTLSGSDREHRSRANTCPKPSAQVQSSAFATRSILAGFLQGLNDFVLVHLVVMYMRQPGRGVDIESCAQASSTPF